ncbi:MAG: hypothetical protein ACYDG2_18660 [Ruminiclostridium sp.]
MYIIYVIIAAIVIVFLFGIRIVRPKSRGLNETIGKYMKYSQPGFYWVIPGKQKSFLMNIAEQMFNSTTGGLIVTPHEAEKVIETLQNELEGSQRMLTEIKSQYNNALNWSKVFDDADIKAKKDDFFPI